MESWRTLEVGIGSRCGSRLVARGLVLALVRSPFDSFLALLAYPVYTRLRDAVLDATFTWTMFVTALASIRTVSALT